MLENVILTQGRKINIIKVHNFIYSRYLDSKDNSMGKKTLISINLQT